MSIVAVPHRGGAHEQLAWALTQSPCEATIAVTLPAPVAPLSAFLAAVPREGSFMWHPPLGPGVAGSGATASIDLEGPERIHAVRAWTTTLFGSLVHYALEGATPMPIRVFGGLAFEAGFSQQTPWEPFGDGCFTLPRWTYVKNEDTASLVLTIAAHDAKDLLQVDRAISEMESITDALRATEGTTTRTRLPAYRTIPSVCVAQIPEGEWHALVEAAKTTLARGEFTKLVAARRCDVTLLEQVNDLDVIGRLIAEPTCTRFAFRRAKSSFVGASPETLFAKEGLVATTEALAGTIRSLGTDPPILHAQKTKLYDSDKDASEHRIVVQEIERALSRLATSVDHPPRAEIRKIRNILHLSTPFVATLREGATAFDLLAALHPTPAVGGLPREGASKWIVKHERHHRGWYTGPVGWFDAEGDGAFVVAIRSGVIAADKAYVYTGAGIVEESDSDLEYAETQLKQLPLLRALGVADT